MDYTDARTVLEVLEEKFMITHSFCDMETEVDIENKIRPNTKLIFVETPINPTMKLIDLKQVIRVAKRNGLLVIVDNTFCSPYLQNRLSLAVTLLCIVRQNILVVTVTL